MSVGATAVLAQSSIEQVAPENAVFVMGVRDFGASIERIKSHPLFAMLADGDQEAALPKAGDMLPEDIRQFLLELIGEQEVPQPTGAVGMAMYTAIDPDLGVPKPAVMAYADYGDQAEMVLGRLQAGVKRATESGRAQSQQRQVSGFDILSIKLPEPEPPQVDPNDPFAGQDPMEMDPIAMMMPDLDEQFRFDSVHFARSAGSMLMSSDLPTLVNGLQAIQGTNERGVTRDNRSFQGIMRQLGDQDAYVAVLTRDLLNLVLSPDMRGMAMMFTPMLRATFGEVQGMGYALQVGDEMELMQQRFSLLMPNGKQGIPALMDRPLDRVDPPAFVGDDAIGLSAMSFEFPMLVPFVDAFMRTNAMLEMQFGEQWAQMREPMQAVLSTLGSQVQMVNTMGDDPENPDVLMVVECTQPDRFRAAFEEMASQMGMEAEDVNGRPLYRSAPAAEDDPMAPGMGLPIALEMP
ncbi:MAG: hypothetical protein ACYTGC_12080, partial [Planctomycetota bacterium]